MQPTTEERQSANLGTVLNSSADEAPQFAYDIISQVDRKHFWYVTRNERVLAQIKKAFPNWQSTSFLEVGCGTGNVIGYLFEQGMLNVTGYDRNAHGLALCRKRYPQIPFTQVDFLSISRIEQQFEAVGIFDVIEHIKDEQAVLQKVRSHLAPGGKVFITVPAHTWLWSQMDEIYGHHRRYTKKSLVHALEKAGFKNIQTAYFMAPLVPLIYLRRKFMDLPEELSQEQVGEILRQDAKYPGDAINFVLKSVMHLEHVGLGMNDFNFGGSLIAVASA